MRVKETAMKASRDWRPELRKLMANRGSTVADMDALILSDVLDVLEDVSSRWPEDVLDAWDQWRDNPAITEYEGGDWPEGRVVRTRRGLVFYEDGWWLIPNKLSLRALDSVFSC